MKILSISRRIWDTVAGGQGISGNLGRGGAGSMSDKLRRTDIPIDVIKENIEYNSETGEFRWKRSRGSAKAGSVAGSVSVLGYYIIKIGRKTYKAHRIAYAIVHGITQYQSVDHINKNKLDNRICNLRIASMQENSRNKDKSNANTSGYKGVTYHKRDNRYQAAIRVTGRRIHLGYFLTAYEAHCAYESAAAKNHGDFYYNKD